MSTHAFRRPPRGRLFIWLLAGALPWTLLTAPATRGAEPLQDSTLQSVHIQGKGGLQVQNDGATDSEQNKADQEPSDAAVAAFLEIPPKVPESISLTTANRQSRLFEENPDRLIPPAKTPPYVPPLPPILQLFRPGPVGDTYIHLTPRAVDNAQSHREGDSLVIQTNTLINEITVRNARDVSNRIQGDYGVHGLNVKSTIKITPRP